MKKYFLYLNTLHILNDGYKSAFLLFLPFIAKDFHLSLTYVGFLAMVVNISTTLLALPSGYLTGKLGGIKILLISIIIYSLGFIFTGLTHSIYFLPITFFVTALGFGAFHTVGFALIAKYADASQRGRRIGEFSAYGEVGRIGIMSVITFAAGFVGWQLSAIVFGILSLIIGLFSPLLKLTEHEQSLASEHHTTQKTSFFTILKDKQAILANFVGVLDCFASGSLYIFIPFLLLARHVPLYWLGIFTSIYFIGSIFSKFLIGPLIDRFGNEKVFIVCEIGMAACILLLTNIPSIIGIGISAIILGAFAKGTAPITQVMAAKAMEKHKNFEKGFALNNFTVSAANVIAPIVLGFLADHFGIFTAFNVAAFFAVLAIAPAIALRWNVKQTKEEEIILAESE